MKILKITFCFTLFVILFASCEKVSDEVFTEVKTEISKAQIDELKSTTNTDFLSEVSTVFGESNYVISSNANDNKKLVLESLSNKFQSSLDLKSAFILTPELHGPFDQLMPVAKTLTNYKMVVSNQPGLATGVYYCDIYRYLSIINLPGSAVGIPNSVTPEGFSNFTNQTPGFLHYTSSSSGGATKFTVISYKIHVRYNILGQNINKVFPTHLNNVNGINLNYSYVTF